MCLDTNMSEKVENLCLRETEDSVTSVSTLSYVPQPLEEKSHYIQNRIFVGNLPAWARGRDLSAVFGRFGEVLETNIVKLGGNRRCGFVSFANVHAADTALRAYCSGKRFLVDGHTLILGRAHFKPKKHMDFHGTRSPQNRSGTHAVGDTMIFYPHSGTVYPFSPQLGYFQNAPMAGNQTHGQVASEVSGVQSTNVACQANTYLNSLTSGSVCPGPFVNQQLGCLPPLVPPLSQTYPWQPGYPIYLW